MIERDKLILMKLDPDLSQVCGTSYDDSEYFFYIIIELPTFTESGRFTMSLAGSPCNNPAFHFHLKEDSG
ncbi:hypothetical protein IWW34DRAFT_349308 [Fusarium oxysporum f. sp. albedinis]|nr:hypothetical protein IWW34DRAFT_349308 [Fusarium oxysporum f. sp. albedinis]